MSARVLILSASYGSGHNAAARSLAHALANEGATVDVVDHFRDLVHPAFDRGSRVLYSWVLKRAPALWGMGYALGDRMATNSPLAFGVTRLGLHRLAARLERSAPDAVVTVHATPAVVMAELARRGRRLPPHTTVVTDFVAHSQWIASHVDRYCVAAEEVKHEFIARGIARERILVTGMPVSPAFEEPVDHALARARLGLSSRAPVVLAMAGAHGAFGGLENTVRVLLDAPPPLQGVVVAGHDAGLARRLRLLTAGSAIRVLGYVDTVRQLMAAADLLVTKAGGMTLAEAMAAELPMILYGSLPGQERRNERFASRTGIALVARTRRELARAVRRALGDASLADHLLERIRRLRRPDASHRIARAVLGLGATIG
jgi:processive 1,2-diacylglycerol beta-glucosyltransferase